MPIVLPDFLVSTAAGERYARWKSDLNKASTYEESESDKESEALASKNESLDAGRSHNTENVELAGCWNESQPYSPRVIPMDPARSETTYDQAGTTGSTTKTSCWSSTEPGNDGQSSVKFSEEDEDSDDSFTYDVPPLNLSRSLHQSLEDRFSEATSVPSRMSEDGGCDLPAPLIQPPPTRVTSPSLSNDIRLSGRSVNIDESTFDQLRQDDITDTVGAIAVDCIGNIAAGSSSGGIGMKHKGRVGPAALVGIGTAVIPLEHDDKERTSVATVTSGTGEHMATTMAAGVCASRLYTSTRRTKRGESESTDEDNAIRSFVERDFMGWYPPILQSMDCADSFAL